MTRGVARVAALLFAIALLGCESAVSGDDGDELAARDWLVRTIAGQAVINPGRVTLSFGEGRVSGRGGCNLYSGPVEYGRGAIKVGPLISTKMACAEPGLMQQELTYLNTLQAATRYALGGNGTLTITTTMGEIVYDSTPRQVRPQN